MQDNIDKTRINRDMLNLSIKTVETSRIKMLLNIGYVMKSMLYQTGKLQNGTINIVLMNIKTIMIYYLAVLRLVM